VEWAVFKYIEQGGIIALIAFLIYLIVRMEKTINKIISKIENVECELSTKYAKKEEIFSDISGWRGDLRAIAEKIDELRKEFFYLKGRYDELRDKK